MVGIHNQPQVKLPMEVPNPTLDLRWCQLIENKIASNMDLRYKEHVRVVATQIFLEVSPLFIGEGFHPFWRSYFSKGLVQPPTRCSRDRKNHALHKCLKWSQHMDWIWLNIRRKFLQLRRKPGGPGVKRKCQENPQPAKRDFWLELPNGSGSVAVDIVDTRCADQFRRFFFRADLFLQNWFFIGILCFNLSMGKTPSPVSWIVRIVVVNDEDV